MCRLQLAANSTQTLREGPISPFSRLIRQPFHNLTCCIDEEWKYISKFYKKRFPFLLAYVLCGFCLWMQRTDGAFVRWWKGKGKKKGIRNESSPPCDRRINPLPFRFHPLPTPFSSAMVLRDIGPKKKEEKVFFLVARNIWRKKKGGVEDDSRIWMCWDRWSATHFQRVWICEQAKSEIPAWKTCKEWRTHEEEKWKRLCRVGCNIQTFLTATTPKRLFEIIPFFFFFSPRSISRGTSWAWLTADLPPSHRLWPSLLLSIPPVCPAQWEPSITHGRDSDRRKSLYPVRAGRLRSWHARTTNRTVWCKRSQICVF